MVKRPEGSSAGEGSGDGAPGGAASEASATAWNGNEAGLRALIAGIAQATWEADAEGVVTTDSPSWRAYTGQSLQEWLGHGWLDAVHGEDRAYAERQLREAIAAGRQANAEFRLRTPSGRWRWTNVRAVPVSDDQGRVRKWMGMNIDIDARRQIERRQAFLLRLSDALRPLTDSAEIERTAMRALADELGADRVFLATIEADGQSWSVRQGQADADGPPGGSVRTRMSEFQRSRLPQWRSGRMSSISDSETDPTLSIDDRAAYAAFGARAAIGVPVIEGGRFAALLCVNHATPRTWTEGELSLAGEAAERIWSTVERVRTEEALRESEARLGAAFDSVPTGIAVIDTSGVVTFSNALCRTYLPTGLIPSRDPANVARWRAWDADGARLPPQDFPGSRALRGEAVVPGQEMLFTDDAGREIWTNVATIPTRDQGGRVTGMVTVIGDIDVAKRSVVALRESDDRLRDVLDSMAEGFALLDADFVIVNVNRETLRLDGRPREQLVGRSHWEAFPGTEDSPVGDVFKRVARTRTAGSIEHAYTWSDGRQLWLEMRVYPTRQGGVAAFWRDVTERRRSQDALRRSEEKYRTLFESMDEAYAVVDLLRDGAGDWVDFRFVDANPAFMKHTTMPYPVGKTATELLGVPNPRWASLYGQVVDTGQPLRVEEAEPTLGRTFDLNIFNLDRGRARVAVLFTDVTERVRAAGALRESEERLRRFGEASQDVLWVRDAAALQWQYLSPAFETIYGLTREEALDGDNYLNWCDLIVAEDRSHAADCIDRIVRGEQVVFEYRIRRPADGQIRWMRDTDFPMRDDDGVVRRIGGVGQDITALKLAEGALAAAEQRQRLLLEGMPQLVWRAVGEGLWTWAGPQWVEHTGQSDEASHGYGWLDVVHPDDRELARAAWRHAQAEGVYQVDYRVRQAASGVHHWFQTRGIPIRRADGSIVEWLGTSTDIDEQVRAREFLVRAGEELEQRVTERTLELRQALDTLHREVQEHEQAEERLRQSEKLKAVGQLTGGIAHDFNNMLQGITSALSLVQTRLGQGRVEAAQSYLEPAQKAAVRAGALTHRLLAFSRQQTLSPRPVNLEQVVRDMEDMVRRAVGPGVQVEVKSADGHWLVLCDANQMESALLNLCINARDAMPMGGWLTIGVDDRTLSQSDVDGLEDLQPGRFVVLSVTDTGTGMPPDVVARAFEPFFTTKPPGQGTGLGLSQIYGFIRQSGGMVQIETVPGQGTTVRLCLPAHQASPSAPEDVPGNGKTVLLVEDEHDLRRMLADQLRDLGYGVLEADTAEAALRIVNTGTRVDLLVTDVGLRGGMNGRQLAEAAQGQIAGGLPVIFITGFAGGHVDGMESVLSKPFKPSLLALLVKEKIL